MALPQEHAPVATPMPKLPSADFMSEAGWDMLFALFDGCLPAIASSSTTTDKHRQLSISDAEFDKVVDRAVQFSAGAPSKEELAAYLAYRPVDIDAFRNDGIRTLANTPQRMRLVKVMELLGSRAGSLLLTGYWNPLTQQPTRVREAVVKSWATSSLAPLRVLAKTVSTLAQKANVVSSPYFGQLSGYSDAPKNWKAGQGYDYSFIQLQPGTEVHEITTDVLVVGSGCGGGVSAKNLSEAGLNVLVVDKGYHFPPSHLPMPQDAACNYLFDSSGVYMTEDGSAGVVCGGAWGGGGTVNWSVCFKLQDYVRKEWADTGLPLFASSDFDKSMDRVWDFIGAGRGGIRHNHRNQVVLDAAEKLAWRGGVVDQNTADKEHYCGHCHLGCGSAEKKGPAVSWLPAAAEMGAEFMEGFQVDKILFGDDNVTAIGAQGTWTSRDAQGGVHTPLDERTQRRVVIKAKKVIMSAGSLWTPVLLARSGIGNQNIGRNLHIHPCNFVTAEYDEDVRPWEGGIITSYIPEFENLDGKGHGVKLEPTCMVPYAILTMQPWISGLDAKLSQVKYRNLNGFIALTRDRDSGRVFPDPKTGVPRIDYTVSDFDRENTLEGIIALAKVCYVTGATKIRPSLPCTEPFVPARDSADGGKQQEKHVAGTDPEFTDPAFGKWLQSVRQIGNKPPVAVWSSAHQMGTCRMSATASTGVVDERGRVWGCKNLYVADASVFPSASGVNPMVTLMSIADWISRGVAKDLQE